MKNRNILSRAAVMLLMILLTSMTAWAETQSVSYIDADGKTKTVTATVLTGGQSTSLDGGWYVVANDITYTGPISFNGDLNLILCDGKTMNVNPA